MSLPLLPRPKNITLIQQTILFLFLFILSPKIWGQPDSSSYKNIKTIKSYLVSLEKSGKHPFTKYKVNGKAVNQATYEKYEKSSNEIKSCKPCINKSYSTNETLIIESVSYGDCGVGRYKEYFMNGNLKISGQFKENHTDNWNDLYDRGYCSTMDGKWIFYNKNGTPKYVEIWKNGNFKKQIPEQQKAEIVKVDLLLHDSVFTKEYIDINQINNLKFQPQFKNKNHNLSLSIIVSISGEGKNQSEHHFTPSTFKTLDIISLLESAGISSDEESILRISIFNKKHHLAFFKLKINR